MAVSVALLLSSCIKHDYNEFVIVNNCDQAIKVNTMKYVPDANDIVRLNIKRDSQIVEPGDKLCIIRGKYDPFDLLKSTRIFSMYIYKGSESLIKWKRPEVFKGDSTLHEFHNFNAWEKRKDYGDGYGRYELDIDE